MTRSSRIPDFLCRPGGSPERYVVVRSESLEVDLQFAARHADQFGVHLNSALGFEEGSLQCLNDYNRLKHLWIADEYAEWGPVSSLSSLVTLLVFGVKRTPGLTFERLRQLEVVDLPWSAAADAISSCHLRRLGIDGLAPQSRDLRWLVAQSNVEYLGLTRPKIDSLNGLENSNAMRWLLVAYAPSLSDVSALAGGDSNLVEVQFEHCKRIKSWAPLSGLRKVRRLIIANSAAIPDLEFVRSLTELEFLSFVDTEIVSGDLEPLLSAPNLRKIGTLDKRRYNMKCDEVNARLSERHLS